MAVNPIGAGLRQERVDQGTDWGGSGPLYALDSGTIVNLYNSGWPGGTFLVLKLNQAINGQQYVYYAEDITPLVKVGQKVSAGDHIANATGGPTGIEVGWATGPPYGQAAAHSQFTGANATSLGQDFLNVIKNAGNAGSRGSNSTGTATGSSTGSSSRSTGSTGSTGSGPSAGDLTSLLAPIRQLLHGVATVIDYSFTMFEPGQGFRLLFGLAAVAGAFLSYRVLASSGMVSRGR
jgi:hypothetical protein